MKNLQYQICEQTEVLPNNQILLYKDMLLQSVIEETTSGISYLKLIIHFVLKNEINKFSLSIKIQDKVFISFLVTMETILLHLSFK